MDKDSFLCSVVVDVIDKFDYNYDWAKKNKLQCIKIYYILLYYYIIYHFFVCNPR